MQELIEFVVKKLVDHPEDVQVRVIESDDRHVCELRVNEEDMGRVIGKQGRTAKALRTLLGSACTKTGGYATLEIVE